ncbi:hypothetical protein M728_005345 (plasmid) [Ensifer sp. WSM1721]|uniref:hypothetical protein n=1 Tax=Ensifer sp. WSM1721 TaxID=1041159 RepID=UPI00047D0A2F|nr:hypothetical protein [Ensifer sp. WSM1721]
MKNALAHAELIAVLTAVTSEAPRVMTVRKGEALPSGPLEVEQLSRAGARASRALRRRARHHGKRR